MSLKQMLGLEHLTITEEEIIKIVENARTNNQEIIEFTAGSHTIRIKLNLINTLSNYYVK